LDGESFRAADQCACRWCYVRSPRPLANWQREAICRAVRRWADRVRRDNREWVWRLKSAHSGVPPTTAAEIIGELFAMANLPIFCTIDRTARKPPDSRLVNWGQAAGTPACIMHRIARRKAWLTPRTAFRQPSLQITGHDHYFSLALCPHQPAGVGWGATRSAASVESPVTFAPGWARPGTRPTAWVSADHDNRDRAGRLFGSEARRCPGHDGGDRQVNQFGG